MLIWFYIIWLCRFQGKRKHAKLKLAIKKQNCIVCGWVIHLAKFVETATKKPEVFGVVYDLAIAH